MSTDLGSFPLTVVFDASGSTDSDGTIAQYDWDYGDGRTGDGSSASHKYTRAGTYTAQLTVTDDSDLIGTATHEIEVKPQYTISGTVTPADYVVSDSDVNDPLANYFPNDSLAAPQNVSAPCSISGYVNVSGEGPEGRSNYVGDPPEDYYMDGDPDDFYEVFLTDGMTITLYMAEDPDSADLNLYLYTDDGTQVDGSVSEGAIESLTVSDGDGTYYVHVQASASASVYTLILGFSGPTAAQSSLRLSDDFVPGEVLVRFEDQAGEAVSSLAGNAGVVSSMGFYTKSGDSGRDRLLRRSKTVDEAAFFNRLGVQSKLARSLSHGKIDAETRAKMETLWMVRALRRQPGVQIAEPNYILKPLVIPNDPYYGYQWHYPLINLPEAWDIPAGTSEVVVAVIDTGVLLDHPDLDGQLVAGYDFISDDKTSGDDEPGVDDNPDDPGDDDFGGSSFHGTHVAGTIAAASDNDLGVAGVAWNAKIMPLRVLGDGGGTMDDILEAVKYAAGLSTRAGVRLSEPVDIINLSLGGGGYSSIAASVFAQAREQGVIVVAAAGNSDSSVPMYPAGYDGVVSVSAVTINETLASYSNHGSTIDVAAPGGDSGDANGDGQMDGVYSTVGDDRSGVIEMGYTMNRGTSMATPHVAGVAALMKSYYSGLTPDEFDSLLQGGYLTRDIGFPGRDDNFGWGLIDAYKAVSVVKDGGIAAVIPANLSASPGTLYLGSYLESAEVTIAKSGGALALVGPPTWGESWVTVTPSDVDVDTGLGTYMVAVNRDLLPDNGLYSDIITFTADNGTQARVAVSVRVGFEAGTADDGYYYVLLMDPETRESIDQVGGAGVGGVYDYSFSGLSYDDRYVVYAGTDPDNDTYVCGDGEACGAYLSLSDPVVLTVNEDIENVDFSTDAMVNLSSGSVIRNLSVGFPLQRDSVKEVSK